MTITRTIATVTTLTVVAAASADIRQFDIDLTDALSVDSFGDLDNHAEVFDLNALLGLPAGSPVSVLGVGYDLGIESFGDSFLADVELHFDDADAALPPSAASFELNPGFGDEFAGIAGYSQPITDLGSALNLTSGSLYLEIFENFDDTFGEAEATLNGTISLRVDVVPAPGSLALLGLGCLVAARRRR